MEDFLALAAKPLSEEAVLVSGRKTFTYASISSLGGGRSWQEGPSVNDDAITTRRHFSTFLPRA